jgi:hypothetical protein
MVGTAAIPRRHFKKEPTMPKVAAPVPAPLASAAGQFEVWRSERTTRRISKELWSLATDLGARYGVCRTAKVLGLHYDALKKRVAVATASAPDAPASPPEFVEVLTAPPTAAGECLVEFEKACGEKMRFHVKGMGTPDLAALSRLFLERRA